MYVIFSYCLDVAELVFNRCSKNNATKDGKITPESKKFKVDFNYEFLEDYRDVQVPSIFNWLVKIVQRVWVTYGIQFSNYCHISLIIQYVGIP